MRCVSDSRREASSTTWTTTTTTIKWGFCLLLFWSVLARANAQNFSILSAVLTYSFTDSQTGDVVRENGTGRYGSGSLALNESGFVVHVRVVDTAENHGCTDYVNGRTDSSKWIALVQRGGCKFKQKVAMASQHNASAIVIYDYSDADEEIVMYHPPTTLATVLVQHTVGQRLATLVDSHIPVFMNITVGSRLELISVNATDTTNPNKHTTVVLLVFVGFLIVGLTVVVVYAVRHAKYVHAKNQATLAFSLQEAQQAQENLLNSDGAPEQQQPHQDQQPQSQQQQLQQQQQTQPQQQQQGQQEQQDQPQDIHYTSDQSSSLLQH